MKLDNGKKVFIIIITILSCIITTCGIIMIVIYSRSANIIRYNNTDTATYNLLRNLDFDKIQDDFRQLNIYRTYDKDVFKIAIGDKTLDSKSTKTMNVLNNSKRQVYETDGLLIGIVDINDNSVKASDTMGFIIDTLNSESASIQLKIDKTGLSIDKYSFIDKSGNQLEKIHLYNPVKRAEYDILALDNRVILLMDLYATNSRRERVQIIEDYITTDKYNTVDDARIALESTELYNKYISEVNIDEFANYVSNIGYSKDIEETNITTELCKYITSLEDLESAKINDTGTTYVFKKAYNKCKAEIRVVNASDCIYGVDELNIVKNSAIIDTSMLGLDEIYTGHELDGECLGMYVQYDHDLSDENGKFIKYTTVENCGHSIMVSTIDVYYNDSGTESYEESSGYEDMLNEFHNIVKYVLEEK